MRDLIVICDISTGSFDVYVDVSDVAALFNIHPKTLRGWIRDGIVFRDGKFVGYGGYHKSNRGGRR